MHLEVHYGILPFQALNPISFRCSSKIRGLELNSDGRKKIYFLYKVLSLIATGGTGRFPFRDLALITIDVEDSSNLSYPH